MVPIVPRGRNCLGAARFTLQKAAPVPLSWCKMSASSKIEWTDATWNPIRGCTKVSPGCAHCYAETFAERFRGVAGHPYQRGFDLRLVPEKLAEPLRWSKSRMVFVNSPDSPRKSLPSVDATPKKADGAEWPPVPSRRSLEPALFRPGNGSQAAGKVCTGPLCPSCAQGSDRRGPDRSRDTGTLRPGAKRPDILSGDRRAEMRAIGTCVSEGTPAIRGRSPQRVAGCGLVA